MEHEVKDHTLKAYKIIKSPDLPFWHKCREIGIEIGIIVFAVTFSIWLHDISEHRQQQKEVKEFLLGLRQDLRNDITEMEGDKRTYFTTGRAFTYISTPRAAFLSIDTLKKYQVNILNTTGLVPNNGRYEGFKSSGKLGNIEDNDLQNDITDLYQETIPTLLVATNEYTRRKHLLFEFFYKNVKRNDRGALSNLPEVLSKDEALNICSTLGSTSEITGRYSAAIEKSKKIISKIDLNYPGM